MKKKYKAYGTIPARVYLGEYEAEDEKKAVTKVYQNTGANWSPSLCSQCSDEIDVGDVFEVRVEEVES